MKVKYKPIKIFFYALIVLIVLVLITNSTISFIIKNKLNEASGKEYLIKVDKINTNILNQTVHIKNLNLNSLNSEKDSLILKITSFAINGISISDIVNTKKISLSKIFIDKPELHIYKKDTSTQEKNKLFKGLDQFTLNKFDINNGHIHIHKTNKESDLIINTIDFYLSNIEINSNTLGNKIPFIYDDIKVSLDTISLPMNDFENIAINSIKINNQNISINHLKMKSIYVKNEMKSVTNTERDWIEMYTKKIDISDYKTDSVYSASTVTIDSTSLYVYRDKLLPDDTSYKPLYSKMLRELPIKLKLDSLIVKNSTIKYDERKKETGKPGSIIFTELNSSITNINNYTDGIVTNIDISSKFMDDAIFNMNWTFEILNPSDYFTLNGKMKDLDITKTNAFLLPNLNVKTKGYINQLSFDIKGNDTKATGELEMIYNNIEIETINKNKLTKKKVLSAIANVFIKKENDNSKKELFEVNRDQEKSFFNYFWLCIKNGTMDTML